MFDRMVTEEHNAAIAKITAKHVKKAERSDRETAWQDCQRLGMDEVTKYCHKHDLPLLGDHMVRASNTLEG